MDFTPDVSSALSQFQRGINVAANWQRTAYAAAAQTPCDSYGRFTVCPHNGSAWWIPDEAAEDPHARHSTELDALLGAADDDTPTWMAVGLESVRLVAQPMHYVSRSWNACSGRAPYVLRIFHYCSDPEASHARLVRLESAPRFARPSWLPRQASVVRYGEAVAPLRCQVDGLFDTPALCSKAPFNDPRPRRLERLLRHAWAASSHSGYVPHAPLVEEGSVVAHAEDGGGATSSAGGAARYSPLTYGEITVDGVIGLLSALHQADIAAEAPPKRPSYHLGPWLTSSDTFVDIGSGVGKVVASVALLSPAYAVGVEVVPTRAAAAQSALTAARAAGVLSDAEAARVELREGDATRPGMLPANATFAYLSNLCFSDALNTALVAALGRLPRLRCVGSLRQLLEPPPESGDETGALAGTAVSGEVSSPSSAATSSATSAATARAARCRLRFIHTVRIRMSWDDTTSLHVHCCARGITQSRRS